jgi:hypothetical protein
MRGQLDDWRHVGTQGVTMRLLPAALLLAALIAAPTVRGDDPPLTPAERHATDEFWYCFDVAWKKFDKAYTEAGKMPATPDADAMVIAWARLNRDGRAAASQLNADLMLCGVRYAGAIRSAR